MLNQCSLVKIIDLIIIIIIKSMVKIFLIPTLSNVANLFIDFLQTVKGVLNSSMTQISLRATHTIIDDG